MSLDTATDANQRFSNRLVEIIQFDDNDPTLIPKDVPGVGDPHDDNGGAFWVTARAQLLAIRGDRLVATSFYVQGAPDRMLKSGAAAVTRRVYVITPSSTS